MTLYIKRKDGNFLPLSPDQVKNISRKDDVRELRTNAKKLAISMRAVGSWLREVQRHGKYVSRYTEGLPNFVHFNILCDKIDAINKKFEKRPS